LLDVNLGSWKLLLLKDESFFISPDCLGAD